MVNYYIEDPKGPYHSEDGTRSFIKLTGSEAFNFLRTPQGKAKRFYKLYNSELSLEDPNHEYYDYIEIPTQKINEFRAEEYRNRYVADNYGISNISITSLEQEEASSEEGTGLRKNFPSNLDVHEEVADKLELQHLSNALKTLNKEELYIIYRLYISTPPATVRDVGNEIGCAHTSVRRRRDAIFKKIKLFLNQAFQIEKNSGIY